MKEGRFEIVYMILRKAFKNRTSDQLIADLTHQNLNHKLLQELNFKFQHIFLKSDPQTKQMITDFNFSILQSLKVE
ncbi:MAG: hypothetical protein CVV64_12780 [Candidatus Wallbacteria bacterium HGW-Wallbacteria-1]|uniref:Uncharacterized protein n=1 Tax=Candidatus Wallbacteria bacterium HGW-Wallbacteria-1 TaxID=2013854 RepID=A0A2N1PN62_9BACT|nr:MAG: hypothetical protein CVV64_12780 [Candidatus Wallbacteria bacterium HGW-Wallbacteria-1]